MKYCTTCRRITEHYLFGSELLCTVCVDDVFTNCCIKLKRAVI